ncbi:MULTISPECIES: substrate-binding periplasmic protein [Pseudomonas]|uniref:Amino acid ABC transporter substrate-binding protein n=1 Tax=Pseudomonas syringae TaxID=317 RepID=A0A085V4Q3_PSESX|nr:MULTISPECIES: transporter substrate-binding domain-containing protein [Pseudomonas]EPJ82345.1 extracellular solute-binding protein [Pseudomonas sp. CFII64]KFE50416.1 amino acid ABC transporter substrate-binding protein [Pseudomonas syringae]
MPCLLRAVGLLGWLLVAQAGAGEKLRLVADLWPPFTDNTLLNGGLATDLVSTALKRAGYDTECQQVPWARALNGVGEGRYDVLVNAWFNQERTKLGLFSSEYLLNRVRFLKRSRSSVEYRELYQLYERPIAVVRGYTYSAEFDSDEMLEKVPVNDFSMAVRMVVAGRVDLAVEDEFVARFYLSQESRAVRDAIEFLPKSLSENSLHILVSLKNPHREEIVANFNREIAAMKADGSYDALFRQHGL